MTDSTPESVVIGAIDKVIEGHDKESTYSYSCLSWKALLAELVSTMMLLFLGCGACIPIGGEIQPLNPPLAIGMMVMFNIQTFSHASGAHMNPAITLAAVLCRHLNIIQGLAYVTSQCIGAIFGYGILFAIAPVDLAEEGVCVNSLLQTPRGDMIPTLVLEFFMGAALVFITCSVWDPVNASKKDSAPVKIGLTVLGLGIVGGPLTGAGLNPARSLGPAVWTGYWAYHWVFWVGPLAGSFIATMMYQYIWMYDRLPGKIIQ